MARFFQGRMLYPSYVGGRRHPRAGRPHPFLYAGARNRRTRAHAYYGTQPTGYGLWGGDPRFSGVSGAAGRVYRHMLAGAMRPQRGTGYRTSHQLGHYRRGLSKAGKDAYAKFMTDPKTNKIRTRHDFGSAREFREARSQARRERSQARREYARDYRNPYTGTKHRRFTKVSHHDPGTGIRRNYFGGFTGNLSKGSRNLINKRRRRLQEASQRYDWGVKNPTMRDFTSGGLRFMSGRGFKRAQAAVKEREGIYKQQKDFQRSLAERRKKAFLSSPRHKRNQALWRSELRGLSVPRRTTHTFTPDDPKWKLEFAPKGYRDPSGRLREFQSYWLHGKSGRGAKWQWNRPPGKIRTHQQSVVPWIRSASGPPFVSPKPFGSL